MKQQSWWSRVGKNLLFGVLALITVDWARRRLFELIGWREAAVEGRDLQLIDSAAILVTGAYALFQALSKFRRKELEREQMLQQFHEKAVQAKERAQEKVHPHA